jgi:uncharacterized protein (TIGR02266 family)
MADTRKDKRAPVSLKVRFKSATVDEFIEQYSRDVSRGGIFIKSSQPMVVGTLLKFQLQLKDESSLIKGVGRVVWTRAEEDATSEQPAGMGIKFIKMDAESRTTVERVIEAHSGEPGTFDRGEPQIMASDMPAVPATNGGAFFPDAGPVVLPPPEDRTAVRHAAQFLASALSEAATDEHAAREAEQKAEEARRRSAQIDAQRLAEAERLKAEQGKAESLPSIMIDPSLGGGDGASADADADRPTDHMIQHAPTSERPTAPKERPKPKIEHGLIADEDTGVTDVQALPLEEPVRAPVQEPAPKKSLLPWVVIAAVVLVAAFVALRSEGPVDATRSDALPADPTPPSIIAAPDEPAPVNDTEAEPVAPSADAAAQAAAPSTPDEPKVPERSPAELIRVSLKTSPDGAEVFVDDSLRGKAPLTLELEQGVEVKVSARAPGRVARSETITPTSDMRPLRWTLAPLPYVLHVETTPPGAVVFAGAKRGTAPADFTFSRAPGGPISVTIRLAGHQTATRTVTLASFEPEADSMRSVLEVELSKAESRPKARPQRAPASAPEATKEPQPAGDDARPAVPVEPPPSAPAPTPTPAPAPVAPKPKPAPAPVAPKPAPSEPIPDNPFG